MRTRITKMYQLDFIPEGAFMYEKKTDRHYILRLGDIFCGESSGFAVDQDHLDVREFYYFLNQDPQFTQLSAH